MELLSVLLSDKGYFKTILSFYQWRAIYIKQNRNLSSKFCTFFQNYNFIKPLFSDLLDDGFSCPDGEVMGPNGRALPHPTFPHPEDCQKFYICRNGVQPQKGLCPLGKVYNEDTFMCDDPEKVQGWWGYYGSYNLVFDLEFYTDKV